MGLPTPTVALQVSMYISADVPPPLTSLPGSPYPLRVVVLRTIAPRPSKERFPSSPFLGCVNLSVGKLPSDYATRAVRARDLIGGTENAIHLGYVPKPEFCRKSGLCCWRVS